jgi:hypothetical protein
MKQWQTLSLETFFALIPSGKNLGKPWRELFKSNKKVTSTSLVSMVCTKRYSLALARTSEHRTQIELLRITIPRLYEKASNTGKPPRHEANHGSIYQRLAARTQPLVVLTHPPLLVDPRQRTLHHPPPRQHHEAFGGHKFLPLYGHALFGPFTGPRHHYLFWGGLFRALHQIHAPSQCLPHPVRALVLSALARVQPQMPEARESLPCSMQQRLDPLVVHHLGAVDLRLESTKPSVSTRMWRLECPSPSCLRRNRAVLRLSRYSLQTENPPRRRWAGGPSSGEP